ncbi:MAG: FkbM family methyltransferase [Devosia sp.]|nr:FkbM family methyltransferase [Devosia sp.]
MLKRLRSQLFAPRRGSPNSLLDRPWEGEPADTASREDILFCFRLLLGRQPNKEEWAGHSSRAGEQLASVVKTYVNSGEFQARGLLQSALPPGITSRHNGRFIVFANGDDPTLGGPALAGSYEPSVAQAIEALLGPGDSFLDVGANLGYFSLLAATLVGATGRVFSVEPNDFNVKLLESSRDANGFEQISVFQVGATDRAGTLVLHATEGNGSTAALGSAAGIFGSRTIAGVPLDNLLAFRDKPLKLIKIDVEGFEYHALRGAQRLLHADRPHIIFEFQGAGLHGIGGRAFLVWLAQQGYELTNLSAGRPLTAVQGIDEIMAEFDAAMVDHLDVLATPSQ